MQKDFDQKTLLFEQDNPLCLDTLALNRLEQSFRDWIHQANRGDIRVSRKRILLIFLLIRYTGAKLNEVLSLDPVQDIDLSNRSISIRDGHSPDTPLLRKIPISQSLAGEIKAMMSDPDFFTSVKKKFSIDPGFVRRKFYERSRVCGFSKKSGGPEMIRKARAVECLKNNMPIPALQSLLGHSTLNLTQAMVSFSDTEIQRITQLFMEKESDRKTSARNSFFGKIKAIDQGDILSRVEMASIDGFSVVATITTDSLLRLGLKSDGLVTVDIKAPSVMLHKPNTSPGGLFCSAENQFKGVVTRVTRGRVISEYVIRISDLTDICSTVTTKHIQTLNLKPGDRVWVLFNSVAAVLHAE